MVASVRPSTELTRIKGLNWRTWSDEDAAELAELLTEKLRKPGGEWTLLAASEPPGTGRTLVALLRADVRE